MGGGQRHLLEVKVSSAYNSYQGQTSKSGIS